MSSNKHRIFPFYFPQFYRTEENDNWWGDGFTDWELVKTAKSIHTTQNQPRQPLSGYYDQSNPLTIKKQAEIALEYGISGFNFYHYWFDGKVLLDKPLQNLYSDKSIDIEYFLTWANETWTRQWVGKPHDVLIKQEHKAEKNIWDEHYNYLRKFFHDDRYVKINNAPILCIYRAELIKSLPEWVDYINLKAQSDGFSGVHLIALRAYNIANAESIYKYFNKIVNFQPRYSINTHLRKTSSTRNIIEKMVRSSPEWIQLSLATLLSKKSKYNKFSYSDYIDSMRNDSDVWNDKPVYQVVFPDWDNAPRYKERATFFSNTSIDNFGKALELVKTKVDNHDDKLVFINAWNEWSEGAYLEPDNKHKFAYLETIKKTFR